MAEREWHRHKMVHLAFALSFAFAYFIVSILITFYQE